MKFHNEKRFSSPTVEFIIVVVVDSIWSAHDTDLSILNIYIYVSVSLSLSLSRYVHT